MSQLAIKRDKIHNCIEKKCFIDSKITPGKCNRTLFNMIFIWIVCLKKKSVIFVPIPDTCMSHLGSDLAFVI